MKRSLLNWMFLLVCFLPSNQIWGDEDTSESDSSEEPRCVQGEILKPESMITPSVYDDNCWYYSFCDTDYQWARRNGMVGIWLPEGPPAFRPFIADPRQVTYSVGWRFNDNVIGKNIADVSFGDTLPVYRWVNLWYFDGDLQLEIEGAVWAVFAPLDESSPLINADYYVGFPLTYLFGDWAIRLRGYHISCHIGDEFLLTHPQFHRRNPSAEYIDLFFSWQFTRDIRLYGGVGWICCQDDGFRCGEYYAEGGVEVRISELAYHDYWDRLYCEPFIAMHFRGRSDFEHHVDATYAMGFEWGKYSGLRRKLRIFIEYHDGYSVEGQFCRFPSNYFGIRGSYGF